MRPGERSVVWKFFKKTANNKLVRCNLCKIEMKYFYSTSNLKQHLVRRHSREFDEITSKSNSAVEEVAYVMDENACDIEQEGPTNALLDSAVQVAAGDSKIGDASFVWSFFRKTSEKQLVVCILCKKQLNYFSDATKLKQHLVKKHKIEYNEGTVELNLNDFLIFHVENDNESISNFQEEVTVSTSKDDTETEEPTMRYVETKSIVWNFFKKTADKKFVVCSLCHRELKYFASPTNLKQHLIRKHPTEYNASVTADLTVNKDLDSQVANKKISNYKLDVENTLQMDTQETLSSPAKRLRLYSVDNKCDSLRFNKKCIDESLIKMIVTEYYPLSIIENKNFLEYTKKLNPLYKPPCKHKLVTNVLTEVYNGAISDTKLMLDSVDYISLTVDRWRSNSNRSYLTLTSHFICSSKICDRVLATKEFCPEDDTEQNIAAVISSIIKEWNIENKIVMIVSDDEINTRNAIYNILHKNHNSCVAHMLCACANDALDSNSSFSQLIEKCKVVVEYYKNNEAINPNIQQNKQGVDHPIWNSCLQLMEKLLSVKNPLSIAFKNNPELLALLDMEEWEVILDFVSLLKPLERMTVELSKDKYMILSLTIPLVRGLQHTLQHAATKTNTGLMLKDTLLHTIANRLGSFEVDEIAAKATFLDPRLKKTAFGCEDNAMNAQKWVLDEIVEMISISVNTAQTLSALKVERSEKESDNNTSSLWLDFETKLAEAKTTTTKESAASVMIRQYLEMPYLHRTENPLEFWEKHKFTLPELYKLYLKYLPIPATSVPSESIFCKTNQLLNRRNLLLPKNLDEIIFLNSFFEYCSSS